MRNHAIAAESVVLLIDVPQNLEVGDRIVAVLHVAAVAFIEAIPEQGTIACRIAFWSSFPFFSFLSCLLYYQVITPSVSTQSCCTQYFWMTSYTVFQFIGIVCKLDQ